MKTLLFSRREIAQIVESFGFDRLMDEIISGLNVACLNFDQSQYCIPVRSGFSYEDEASKGVVEWMPAIRYGDRAVIKVVGYHPNNAQQFRLPTVLSTVITFDTQNGHATSIVDATFLTSLRTGAASAVASSVLASPHSKVLGLIGAGAQAVTQLHALTRAFELEQILIYDLDILACESFSDRASYAGIEVPIKVCSMDELLRSADIICTSTSIDVSDGPLFEDTELKSGVHINAVGSDFPGKFELPRSLLKRSLVCPDFLAQAVTEGECQQLRREEIGPDLPALVKESARYSEYRDQATVFDSTGWALEDLVAADILTTLGTEAGYGTPVDLACISDDPKSPYGFIDKYRFGDERLIAGRLHRL